MAIMRDGCSTANLYEQIKHASQLENSRWPNWSIFFYLKEKQGGGVEGRLGDRHVN